jgi:hypothetical protein
MALIRPSSAPWETIRSVTIQFQSRAVTIGFPGAGNVLANTICTSLLEQSGIPDTIGIGNSDSEDLEAKNAILSVFAERHQSMLSFFQSALPQHMQSYFTHSNIGVCNFVATRDGGDFLIVPGIDIAVYLNARVHTTHETPIPAAGAFYRSKGFKTILAIRHPLALIAAFAAKGFDPNDKLVRRSAESAGASLTDFMRATRLSSPTWIRRTAYLIREYYLPAVEQMETLPFARFEEALENPARYVEWLAKQLSVPVSKESAEAISKVIGTKPLAPDHFNQPSLDGWRSRFTAADLDVIQETGLFSTFEHLGYSRPNAADLRPMPEKQLRLRVLVGGQDKAPTFKEDFVGLSGTFESNELAKALGAANNIFSCRVGEFKIVASDERMMIDYASRLSGAALAATTAFSATAATARDSRAGVNLIEKELARPADKSQKLELRHTK